jgi:hypothetical protein
MVLNVCYGSVSGSSIVQTPGPDPGPDVTGLTACIPQSTNQVVSVSDLINDANNELCDTTDGLNNTVAAGAGRTCEGFKKDTLDHANNNLNFVEGQACAATFDLNPSSSTYSFPQ